MKLNYEEDAPDIDEFKLDRLSGKYGTSPQK